MYIHFAYGLSDHPLASLNKQQTFTAIKKALHHHHHRHRGFSYSLSPLSLSLLEILLPWHFRNSLFRRVENCIYTKGHRKSRTYVIHHKMSKRGKRISMAGASLPLPQSRSPLSLSSSYFCKPKCSLTYQRERPCRGKRGWRQTGERGADRAAAPDLTLLHDAAPSTCTSCERGRQRAEWRKAAHTHTHTRSLT